MPSARRSCCGRLVLLGGIAAFGFNFQILLPLFATRILDLGRGGLRRAVRRDGHRLPGRLADPRLHAPAAGDSTDARRRHRVRRCCSSGSRPSRSVWIAAPLIVGAGYASMLMINTINATVQANVDRCAARPGDGALRHRLRRIGAARGLFAGAVAEALGTPAAFLAGSALSALTLAVVALGLRAARRRGELGVTTIDSSSGRAGALGAAADARPASAAR